MTVLFSRTCTLLCGLSCLALSTQAFVVSNPNRLVRLLHKKSSFVVKAFYGEGAGPSDYDDVQEKKGVEIDENEEDDVIRDALKRELLLFSSVTNRGEYATTDEQVSYSWID